MCNSAKFILKFCNFIHCMKIDKNKNYRYEAALNRFSFLFFNRSVINRYKQNARLKPFVLFDVQDSHEHLSQTTG